MIQFSYEQPLEGQKRLSGTYTIDGGVSYTFSLPIIYNNDIQDLTATEQKMTKAIETALETLAVEG
jgi:hypothetical protein